MTDLKHSILYGKFLTQVEDIPHILLTMLETSEK